MKRLLVLSPAPVSAAATRFRLVQFFPALRAVGIEPVLRSFLDEEGFRVLYRRGHRWTKARSAARALGGRLVDLVRATRSSAVLIHREAALVGPPIIEWNLARVLERPIVFDLDDAVWVPYASPTYGATLSGLLKMPSKTHFTLAAAQRVVAGNAYLAEYARRFNRRVDVVPTVVDTEVFRPAIGPKGKLPLIGWIGTHSSLQYLRGVAPALRELARRRNFVLRVVGAQLDEPGIPVENVPWTLEGEVAEFQKLDIGIYPLVEDTWSVGKSGFKAVQYMACGVPMVASPVGVTTEMIRHGENGFLAADNQSWVSHMEALLDDAALRRRVAEAGRQDAMERWSLAVHAPRMVEIIGDAMR
jgi:glycosyltransferase involved in cell wall biosynthesis